MASTSCTSNKRTPKQCSEIRESRLTSERRATQAAPAARGRERDRVAAMTQLTYKIPWILVAGFAIAACATDDPSKTDVPVTATTVQKSEICTPGYETCDYGCYEQHGPSTNDCIIKC